MSNTPKDPKSDSKSKTDPKSKSDGAKSDGADAEGKSPPPAEGWRETFESLAVALILALTFRTFVAEAFVIPTGSMAPTLVGRHRDVPCAKCGYQIHTGASLEENDGVRTKKEVLAVRCPQCAFEMDLNPNRNWNEDSFAGDRIVVSKLAGEPKRWDVIVFKNPEKAQVNYIKRLIGLPNEFLKIEGGNIFTAPLDGDQLNPQYVVARKPDGKLLSMLQPVFDTEYPCEELIAAGWPSRWQPSHDTGSKESGWTVANDQKSFSTPATEGWSEIRYRHFEPRPAGENASDWEYFLATKKLADDVPQWSGALIADGYAYNAALSTDRPGSDEQRVDFQKYIRGTGAFFDPMHRNGEPQWPYLGIHWVGDLAVECTATVESASGKLAIDLVRGGSRYRCEIDIATGKATTSIVDKDGNAGHFGDDTAPTSATGETPLKGAGTYRLRLTNVDDEIRLWVNDRRIEFDIPTTYPSDPKVLPHWTDTELGDLAPAGFASQGAAVKISRVLLSRDKYYIASNRQSGGEYQSGDLRDGYLTFMLSNPRELARDKEIDVRKAMASRGSWVATLREDQFLPLGDNSPASQDARYWHEPFVPRKLLIGKALFVYWPHTWNNPMFWPNWRRMRPIH